MKALASVSQEAAVEAGTAALWYMGCCWYCWYWGACCCCCWASGADSDEPEPLNIDCVVDMQKVWGEGED